MKNKGKIACFLKTPHIYLMILYTKDIPFLASKFDLLCMSYLKNPFRHRLTSIDSVVNIVKIRCMKGNALSIVYNKGFTLRIDAGVCGLNRISTVTDINLE
jgi:hypothetical protein